MITALVFGAVTAAALCGFVSGFLAGRARSREGRDLARYLDAITLAHDLTLTPDARDLRPRASRLLDAHRAAYPDQEI